MWLYLLWRRLWFCCASCRALAGRQGGNSIEEGFVIVRLLVMVVADVMVLLVEYLLCSWKLTDAVELVDVDVLDVVVVNVLGVVVDEVLLDVMLPVLVVVAVGVVELVVLVVVLLDVVADQQR
jgi:hypothetical protein